MDVDRIAFEVLTRTGTPLYDLVGTRVDYARTPAGFTNDVARLVFRLESGGESTWGSGIADAGFLFECWGGDRAADDWTQAKAVYAALKDIWHDATDIEVDGGVLMKGYLEQHGVPVVHPTIKKNYIVARFGGRFRGA
jgi:hypothetical protein